MNTQEENFIQFYKNVNICIIYSKENNLVLVRKGHCDVVS